nr:replication protein A 32 kDa subunit-like [Megalopta genalis]
MWGNLNDTHSTENVSGGFFNNDQNAASANKNIQRSRNIVPVMIGLLNKSAGELKICGIPIYMISIVGMLRHIDESATKETYEIEDETGTITAFRWLEADKSSEASTFKLNTYVRVYGHLREQDSKKHVLVLKIRALTNLNELTSHLLEVAYIVLKSKKVGMVTQKKTDTDDVMTNNNVGGLTKAQTLVFEIIQAENDSENGIHKSVLTKKVPKSILPKISDILHFLTTEGHIYTTLDEDHYKTT